MTTAPDYVEPVLAWRTWLVVPDGEMLTLSSPLFRTAWLPAEPAVAECLRQPTLGERLRRKTAGHAAPEAACACGIYGATLTTATGYLRAPAKQADAMVIGVVSLWGDVVEGNAGWRASRAYPRRIFVPPLASSPSRLAEGLAAYGVPVDRLDGCRDLVVALARLDPLR